MAASQPRISSQDSYRDSHMQYMMHADSMENISLPTSQSSSGCLQRGARKEPYSRFLAVGTSVASLLFLQVPSSGGWGILPTMHLSVCMHRSCTVEQTSRCPGRPSTKMRLHTSNKFAASRSNVPSFKASSRYTQHRSRLITCAKSGDDPHLQLATARLPS